MGVLPIQLKDGITLKELNLSGNEIIDVNLKVAKDISHDRKIVQINIFDTTGNTLIRTVEGLLRIDTEKEFEYVRRGNILNYVLEELSG